MYSTGTVFQLALITVKTTASDYQTDERIGKSIFYTA